MTMALVGFGCGALMQGVATTVVSRVERAARVTTLATVHRLPVRASSAH